MDLNTYDEATMLLNRYRICEEIMVYLTDKDKPRGMRYKEKLSRFVELFPDEYMIFVNQMMMNAGMAFEDLHCPCRPDDDENSTEQENPKS